MQTDKRQDSSATVALWWAAASASTTSGSLFPWPSAITTRACSAISDRAAVLTLQVSHHYVIKKNQLLLTDDAAGGHDEVFVGSILFE